MTKSGRFAIGLVTVALLAAALPGAAAKRGGRAKPEARSEAEQFRRDLRLGVGVAIPPRVYRLAEFLSLIRRQTNIPLGLGKSTPDHPVFVGASAVTLRPLLQQLIRV